MPGSGWRPERHGSAIPDTGDHLSTGMLPCCRDPHAIILRAEGPSPEGCDFASLAEHLTLGFQALKDVESPLS